MRRRDFLGTALALPAAALFSSLDAFAQPVRGAVKITATAEGNGLTPKTTGPLDNMQPK